MIQKLNLSGQSALIMGASQGIGLATAKTLAAYGAKVTLASRTFETVLAEANKLTYAGYEAYAVKCDVSKHESVVKAVEYTLKTSGIDILVNNAGVIEPLTHLIESDPKIWGQAVDINYKGVYYCMREVIPTMIKNGGGIVINMSSGAANSALVGWSHYCSTKAAAKKLTEVAHKELIDQNIRVIGLSPGTVATSMMKKISDSKINVVSNLDWESHISPEWVAEGVAFLCGEKGAEFAGTDFSLKTPEGRQRVGLPLENTSGS